MRVSQFFATNISLLGALVGCAGIASAQINVGGVNPLTYSQNFDTLQNTPLNSTPAFVNNTTIAGLYAAQSNGTLSTYRVGDGSSNAGALYSFGVTGNTDRALGSVSSGTPQTLSYGFRFLNTGTDTISSFTVSYTGEQWRTGGGVTQAQALAFSYSVGATAIDATGYTPVSGLDFSVTDTGTAAAGVTAPIRTATISQTVTAPVSPGQEVWVRFQDINDVGSDHGLAVDDFNIGFSTVIPETNTFGLLALALPIIGGVIARRRK